MYQDTLIKAALPLFHCSVSFSESANNCITSCYPDMTFKPIYWRAN